MSRRNVSDSTVRRLSVYVRALGRLDAEVVSSRQLAAESGTTPAQVRKDLSMFGSFGKRGRGYRVAELRETLRSILGLEGRWPVCLVGAGKIGTALLDFQDLERRGFHIVAAFDNDPRKVGRVVAGVSVEPMESLEEIVAEREIAIGIIATPPEAAQETADRLVAAGLRGILNFAPVRLSAPSGVVVRGVDVTLELEGLTFALAGDAGEERRVSGSQG